ERGGPGPGGRQEEGQRVAERQGHPGDQEADLERGPEDAQVGGGGQEPGVVLEREGRGEQAQVEEPPDRGDGQNRQPGDGPKQGEAYLPGVRRAPSAGHAARPTPAPLT